jgi:hypothetical protein
MSWKNLVSVLGLAAESARTATAAAAVKAAMADGVFVIGARGEAEAQKLSVTDRSYGQPGLTG